MRKLLLIIIFATAILNTCPCPAQNRVKEFVSEKGETGCDVLLDIDYKGLVSIFDSTGNIIKRVSNNIKKQDFIMLDIIGKNDSMYLVVATSTYGTMAIKGWIRKNEPHIGIYVRNYSSRLNLYQSPATNSAIKDTLNFYAPVLFHVTDCTNNWLYVSITILDTKYEGWLSPDMQCANPYTTCN